MNIFILPSTNRWYLTLSAIIFTTVAFAHLLIIVFQMPAVVGGYIIPYEINGLVVILLGYLAVRGFIAAHRL